MDFFFGNIYYWIHSSSCYSIIIHNHPGRRPRSSPDRHRFRPHRRRKSCWPEVWISSRWPRLSCGCTPCRWPPGSRPRGSATGSDLLRPYNRIRWPCTVFRPRGWLPLLAGTPGTLRPWARPDRGVWAERCRCPASVNCGCGGCTWWPPWVSVPPGSRTSGSGRGRPPARRSRHRTSQCWKKIRWRTHYIRRQIEKYSFEIKTRD